ncbi:MAG TPA: GatB/YqeY domain-containing protein [Bacteroidales bacterium]|nr:GatB/YqeY domain-containing protein [Bacteroidales bacterium]HPR57193.1 GatB/YqeY domain-containing protein [Bacteroidales bacterium]HRW96097.1 GatB/YqeY domain-containing protein [Bacteroidales bacterium]
MNLVEQINNDIKQAMLARDKRRLEALRAIKAALLLIKTGKDTSSDEIPETVEMHMLQKLVKQRFEAGQIYKEQNRPDLADEELYQAEIIQKYLPEQLSAEEMKTIVLGIISEVGATSIKDMGKVMGLATKKLSGKADNKAISEIVKQALQG